MSEVKADLPALERFATQSMNRRDDFDQLRGRMDAVHLHRESFGYIPGIGNRIHDAYEDFVTGCADAISSAAETMASMAAAVRGTMLDYSTSDHATADALHTIQSDLGGVNLRNVR
jgi:hypothetical protein